MKPSPLKLSKPALKKRLADLKTKQAFSRLAQIDAMLTSAGVPEWVDGIDDVPSNSHPARLGWFLARRKDIKPSEKAHELDLARDMTHFEQHAREWRKENSP